MTLSMKGLFPTLSVHDTWYSVIMLNVALSVTFLLLCWVSMLGYTVYLQILVSMTNALAYCDNRTRKFEETTLGLKNLTSQLISLIKARLHWGESRAKLARLREQKKIFYTLKHSNLACKRALKMPKIIIIWKRKIRRKIHVVVPVVNVVCSIQEKVNIFQRVVLAFRIPFFLCHLITVYSLTFVISIDIWVIQTA